MNYLESRSNTIGDLKNQNQIQNMQCVHIYTIAHFPKKIMDNNWQLYHGAKSKLT